MQALQSNYGGWASDQIVPALANYARVVFQALGNKSVNWSTFNEPINFCFLPFAAGSYPLFIKDLVRLQTLYQTAQGCMAFLDTATAGEFVAFTMQTTNLP